MRTIMFLLLTFLTAFTLAGCKGKSDATTAGGGGGTAGIEGTYVATGMEWGGEKATQEELGKMGDALTVTITADTITHKKGKGDKGEVQKYKLDSTKTPAEIDLTITEPDGKTMTLYGIYKLEGDTLTL